MKYVIMFTASPEVEASLTSDEGKELYGKVYRWFEANDAHIVEAGAELQPVHTATTVRGGGVVVDGPFSEAKEVVGGFCVLDVADLDAAIAIVKTWPMLEMPDTSVEIRPMVTDYSQFTQ